MSIILLTAIKNLELDKVSQNIILLICLQELIVSTLSQQTNPLIAASIIFTFLLIKRGKEEWAAAFMMLGFLIKIYGIAALAFIVFSKRPAKFLFYSIAWGILFSLMPMLISSPGFIYNSYVEWISTIFQKHNINIQLRLTDRMQDISLMGFFRRILNQYISDYLFIIPAVIFLLLPFLRKAQHKILEFQYSYLALVLLSVVLFSSSSESPTYIIAMVGAAIWFTKNKKGQTVQGKLLLVFLLFLTSFSMTDFFPASIRNNYIIPYSLKALPCIVIYGIIVWELLFKDFTIKHELAQRDTKITQFNKPSLKLVQQRKIYEVELEEVS